MEIKKNVVFGKYLKKIGCVAKLENPYLKKQIALMLAWKNYFFKSIIVAEQILKILKEIGKNPLSLLASEKYP